MFQQSKCSHYLTLFTMLFSYMELNSLIFSQNNKVLENIYKVWNSIYHFRSEPSEDYEWGSVNRKLRKID